MKRENYEFFEQIEPRTVEVIDKAYDAIATQLAENGYKVFGDDRAEKLVEAIATYIIECRN